MGNTVSQEIRIIKDETVKMIHEEHRPHKPFEPSMMVQPQCEIKNSVEL